MDAETMGPLEAMLRRCAQEAPKPWYPRLDAEKLGVPLEEVYRLLELLFLSNLVEKAPGSPETGPGVVLTPFGTEVLNDEELLERLREGRALGPDDRGGAVREMIMRPRPPLLSRLLLLTILAWFGYSVYLAWQLNAVQAFLAVNPFGGGVTPNVLTVLEKSGAVSGVALVHHEWTRLLTAPFVTIGLIHLLFELMILVGAGARAEQMWGRERFLAIYVLTAVGSCVIGVAMQPVGIQAGATGALCGLLGAEVVWLAFNGRYLPKEMRTRWRFGLTLNVFFIIAISFIPGGGVWGFLGAGVIGAVLGVLLNYQRFGPEPFRWLAVPVVGLLPLAGWQFLQHMRREAPQWRLAEQDEFARYYERRVNTVRREALKAYRESIQEVAAIPAQQRKAENVTKGLEVAAAELGKLRALHSDLSRAGPYSDEETAKKRDKSLEAIDELITRIAADEKSLREGREKERQKKKEDKKREEEFEEKYLPLVVKALKHADRVLTETVRALTAMPAAARNREEVTAALSRLAELDRELEDVEHEFLLLRRYDDKDVEEAAQTGREYLTAAKEYGRLVMRYLRGDGWKPQDDATLKEKAAEVERLRAKLRELFWRP